MTATTYWNTHHIFWNKAEIWKRRRPTSQPTCIHERATTVSLMKTEEPTMTNHEKENPFISIINADRFFNHAIWFETHVSISKANSPDSVDVFVFIISHLTWFRLIAIVHVSITVKSNAEQYQSSFFKTKKLMTSDFRSLSSRFFFFIVEVDRWFVSSFYLLSCLRYIFRYIIVLWRIVISENNFIFFINS